MADDLEQRLRSLRVVLKSGDYDGGDLMRAWCCMSDAADEIQRLRAEVERLEAESARAWRERNIACAKVKAWEDVVYVESLPLRPVRVDGWGPGEGEETSVPIVTPKKLTELLDEMARLQALKED